MSTPSQSSRARLRAAAAASSRSSRQSTSDVASKEEVTDADVEMNSKADTNETKLKPAAALAAAAATSAAPAGGRLTRKRASSAAAAAVTPAESRKEDKQQEEADSAPASKRARTATRGKAQAAAAASAAAPDSTQQQEDQEQEKEAKDAQTDAELNPLEVALDAMRTATVGHLFGAAAAAAASSSAEPAHPFLPLCLLFSTFDFISIRDIACGAALSSRAGYATAVDYALLVKSNVERKEEQGVAPSAAASLRTAAAAAAAAPSSAVAFHSLLQPQLRFGVRSDPLTFSIRNLTSLLSSRLRFLVTAVRTDIASAYVDVKGLAHISERLPQLQEFQCRLHSASVQPTVVFPPLLQSLSVELDYFIAPHLSKRELELRNSAPPKSWSREKCDEYTKCVMEGIAALPRLTSLHFGVAARMERSLVQPSASWLHPLKALTRLQTISFSQSSRMYSLSCGATAQLRALPSLTRIASFGSGFVTALPALLADPLPFKLQELPLENVSITEPLRALLLTLHGSLTSLCPLAFRMADVSWVSAFTQLRSIRCRFVTNQQTDWGPVPISPRVESVVALLRNMPQLTDVFVAYPDFTNAHLSSTLAALTQLRSFALQSTNITSLEPFTDNKQHLARTLQKLQLVVPNVRRDHVQHLLSLSELTTLDINQSFTEPLFASQLFAFQPPYPKEPLHWLRSFTPRSKNEAVPMAPVDLAAVAAAQVEFGLRVQAGEVRAAELLNSAQLSGVMQFLSMKDFSVAGRTCRAWRSAASLPSAWGLVDRSRSNGEVATGSAAAAATDDSAPNADSSFRTSKLVRACRTLAAPCVSSTRRLSALPPSCLICPSGSTRAQWSWSTTLPFAGQTLQRPVPIWAHLRLWLLSLDSSRCRSTAAD